ncbi:cytochrome b [Caldimonas brevitalea]|uniref:Cytochrome B561 n=1 Tax=Caldimonas brevitalea TaxID=413882 RepID=A0A0G3BUF6_9BURK|nr:cytochrome b [Caldimonas brevitalea]AKJ31653.1 cytochrome B561 [Caldimonas brevitalea]
MQTTVPVPGSVRYSGLAIAFHWVLAVAIVVAFCVGFYMTGLSMSPTRLKLYNWHKWAGVVILALSAARLLWRLLKRPPALPDTIVAGMPRWQQVAHHATHGLLYLLFFAVPLVGWAYSSSAGFPIVLFGTVPLPDFVTPDKALAEVLKPIHRWLAYTLASLVVVHIAAALKHHFIDRDGLLARMVPGLR